MNPTDTRLNEIERIMLDKHNIALGVFGIGRDAFPTSTRAAFYERAKELGVIGSAELEEIQFLYRRVWRNSLSD